MTNGNENKVVDYLDGFQYAGNVLQFFPHAEGYVNVIDDSFTNFSSFNYVFNHTDHLGNIRLSYTKNPQTGVLEILDETHYYPFGLKHEVYIPANKQSFVFDQNSAREALTNVTETDYQYKYNGKEWQDELGLNMYAMDMRMYDPAIARWVVQDPVTHFEFSPYNAFDNNPVFWADPSGADAVNVGYDRVVDSKDISGSVHWSGGFQEIQNNGKDNGNNANNQSEALNNALSELEQSVKKNPGNGDPLGKEQETDPLMRNKENAISLDKWIKKYKNWSQEEIALERGKDSFGLPLGPVKDYRYVINPYDGKVMDMRHVVVVGYGMGTVNGYGAEIIQKIAGWFGKDPSKSAFDPQDKYSNSIGSCFFDYDMKKYGLNMSNNFGERFGAFLKESYKKSSPSDKK